MADNEDDLASLDVKTINEGAVVELIRRRYSRDKIYTAVGDILLSVNPFKHLPIYGTEVIQAYQIHKQTDSCHHMCIRSARLFLNQCATPQKVNVSEIQVFTGPVYLGSFWNATTIQNINSSRFAMYYEVYFSPEFKLSGGKVHHYMLEKSRVVHQEKATRE
ncbi:Unconventional myosin-Ie [Desmophyllum pertusum]|uniref:Unconventional myosin-Ie n=1 Tax=Desmophyllum pertusum TaxID=174260 RepID=A0A9X0CJX2_9CNID|nr:Unconventional myosin-Ie [Desmophyllum pertusum]